MISTERPTCGSTWALPIFKLPAGARATLTLQSRALLFCGTHWLDRQFLCSGPDCPGCERGASRVRGFGLALWDTPRSQRPVIVEASSSSWSRVEGLRTMEGLRFAPGLVLEASKNRRNSPLRLEPVSAGGPVEAQFEAPWRLAAALAVLFNLSGPASDEPLDTWEDRVRPQALAQLVSALKAN